MRSDGPGPRRRELRRVVTGEDVQSLPEGAIVDLPTDAIITDVAREWIEKKHLRIVAAQESMATERVRVAVGSDHHGLDLKEAVKELLDELGASFIDYGSHSTERSDYPDFAHAVALAVALGHAELGIVVDRNGVGSAIVANKVPGVRAAPCPDEAAAESSRTINDANVLSLGARVISRERMEKVVRSFLSSKLRADCHRERVRKISEIEKKYCRPI